VRSQCGKNLCNNLWCSCQLTPRMAQWMHSRQVGLRSRLLHLQAAESTSDVLRMAVRKRPRKSTGICVRPGDRRSLAVHPAQCPPAPIAPMTLTLQPVREHCQQWPRRSPL